MKKRKTYSIKWSGTIYPDDMKGMHEFINIPIDNGTLHVTVPTPKNWKCKRKGCKTDFYHTHTTYGKLI